MTTANEYVDRWQAERDEAERRIKVVRIPKAERDEDRARRYDARRLPYEISHGRGGYRVSVDGAVVAYLYYRGGWGRGSWKVRDLALSGHGRRRCEERWAHGKSPCDLGYWLRTYYRDGTDYPTLERLDADNVERLKRRVDDEARAEAMRAERAAADEARKVAARTALEGLHEIAALNLTNFRAHALAFAIEEVRKIAEA